MKEKVNKQKQLWLILPAILGAIVWAISPIISSNAAMMNSLTTVTDVTIEASLSGAPINGTQPFGRAEYRVDSNNRRRLKVDAFSVSLPAGTTLTVSVNNAPVGQLVVSSFGSGFLDIRTDNGQSVPTVSNGMPVTITNGGTTILSGTFGIVTGSPSPSVSPTGSPTGSPSPSPTGSPNGTPSPSPSGTPTGTPSPSPTASPSPSPGGIFAQLTGAPINGAVPSGFSEYSLHQSGTNRRIRVWTNFVNLTNGTALTVEVGSVTLGQFTINGGFGEFRIESRDNPIVPVVTPGMPIRILNGSTVVLSGVYQLGVSPSPSPSPTASPSPTGSPSPSPSASPTPATARFYEAELRGSQVVPAVNTDARSVAKILLNQAGTEIQVITSFFGLSGNQTGAAIYGAALPGANGLQIFDLGTIGGTSGFFPTRTFAINPEQAAQLRAGLWYVVIKSANHPEGEIRGQVRAEDRVGDFEGDGRTDVAVFRPSTGSFYFLNSSNEQFRATTLGGANDKLVTGDYDGDGVTDAAVFTNVGGAGVWVLQRSSDGQVTNEQWGLADDVPATADFDGDGRNDLAVFRPSSGSWYIRRSSDNSFLAMQWGMAGDKPVPADFDGDGRGDVAVFRPSNGTWYAYLSSNGSVFGVQWGGAEDIPQVGDFDGDGVADATVFRPSTGTWYTRRSLDGGYRGVFFGMQGDIPAAGEYDSDSLTDIAVFRPSVGAWYILRSSDEGITTKYFGTQGDRPATVQ